MLSHKQALDILQHWDLENEPIAAVGRERSGETGHRAFHVGTDWVLKLSSNAEEVTTAVALHDAAEGMDSLVARLIRTTRGESYVQDGDLFCYVTQRICGTPMTAHDFYVGDHIAPARRVGESIARLHLVLRRAKAHVRDVNLFESVKNWAMPVVKELLSLPDQFCDDYLHIFGGLYNKLPKQIIHRDPNPSNIIVSRDRCVFVDFDLSERNLRVYDPCYAALTVLSESFNEKDQTKLSQWLEVYRGMLSGYDRIANLTAEERAALPYVALANQLVSTAWFSKQDEFAALFKTNKRMTLWLMENLHQLRIN